MRWVRWAALAVAAVACGSGPATNPAALASASPSPTLTSYDQELLTELQAIDFQVYETPIQMRTYVFKGAGLNYDRNTVNLEYGGLVIDEWKALNFNPASGRCSTADPQHSWNCAFLADSPGGHALYAGPVGSLPGYPPDLGDVYLELGSTVVHIGGASLHVPSLADLDLFADSLKPLTAEQVVALNRQARDFNANLAQTAASRIDFKTYLPQIGIDRFQLDKKLLTNPADPLHPYLYMHFGRIAQGNEAFEFTAFEFRDSLPLSAGHCGPISPEQGALANRCSLWFKTAAGVAVYSDYETTRFDLPLTRVVLMLSRQIDDVTQDEMSPFVDSFKEVRPQDIPGA